MSEDTECCDGCGEPIEDHPGIVEALEESGSVLCEECADALFARISEQGDSPALSGDEA